MESSVHHQNQQSFKPQKETCRDLLAERSCLVLGRLYFCISVYSIILLIFAISKIVSIKGTHFTVVNPAQDTVNTPPVCTPAWTTTGAMSTNLSFPWGRESKEERRLAVTTALREACSPFICPKNYKTMRHWEQQTVKWPSAPLLSRSKPVGCPNFTLQLPWPALCQHPIEHMVKAANLEKIFLLLLQIM